MIIMVLADHETWTSISGCAIVEVPDDHDDEVEGNLKDIFHHGEEVKGYNVITKFD